MYLESVRNISETAKLKIEYLKRSGLAYMVASILAGTYIGIGVVLIFAVGAPLAVADSIFIKILMGISFGIALTLVVFAGAELFTGNNMFMAIGLLKKEVTIGGLLKVWGFSWVGNLIGSLGLAYLVVHSGAVSQADSFIEKVSIIKMNMPGLQLFLRGILCNWLVCLALWTSIRTKSDAAKCILIFWCLFVFISSGYEHSIANMTLLSLSLFSNHADTVSWLGFARNLFYVTLGNIVGGAFFVGALYCIATHKEESQG
ncbi:MAG TPA: formate/nitrite transporter family protein [Candidatus Omnitrophota bacterium]|nr:formate/nitrite transporter family protein [Candidatus Omnitrophota bacterium]